MVILRFVILGAISFSLLACAASSIHLSENAKQKLTAFSISNNVGLPKQSMFSGPGSAFSDIGYVMKSSDDQSNTIVNYLLKNNINIASIVKESFVQQAAHNAILAGKIQQEANTIIELEVLTYGIGQKRGLANGYKPILSVVARMKNSDAQLIWKQYDFVTVIGGDSPALALEQYFTSPDVFRVAFKMAAYNVVMQLLEDLN